MCIENGAETGENGHDKFAPARKVGYQHISRS